MQNRLATLRLYLEDKYQYSPVNVKAELIDNLLREVEPVLEAYTGTHDQKVLACYTGFRGEVHVGDTDADLVRERFVNIVLSQF